MKENDRKLWIALYCDLTFSTYNLNKTENELNEMSWKNLNIENCIFKAKTYTIYKHIHLSIIFLEKFHNID